MKTYDEKARAIMFALREWGLPAIATETLVKGKASIPMIAVVFRVLDGKPEWTRAFALEAETATGSLFAGEFRAWKKKIRQEMSMGMPSGIVQEAVQKHGLRCVEQAVAS